MLNPIIRGWARYYRGVVSKEIFGWLDDWMFNRAFLWARRIHPRKSWTWRSARYWGQLKPSSSNRWIFGDKTTGRYLLSFASAPIGRHVMVNGSASPDDHDLADYRNNTDNARSPIFPAAGSNSRAANTASARTASSPSSTTKNSTYAHHAATPPRCPAVSCAESATTPQHRGFLEATQPA
ncbi:MAG: hypothetical protein DYH08_13145 [Actinobacteria bacterium ATB1]|nr:hypothetical protein [Actinobacteria bacterium ATB1]